MNKFIFSASVFAILFSITSYTQNSFEISFSTPDDEQICASANDNSGNTILVGRKGSMEDLFFNALLIKVFPDGSYISIQFDSPSVYSEFSSVNILDNGNYFITGCYAENSFLTSCDNFWILILDNSLEVVVEKTFQIPEGYQALATERVSLFDNTGNIAMVSLIQRQEGKRLVSDYLMIKFNQQGDTLLTHYYTSYPSSRTNSLSRIPGTDSLMLIGTGSLMNGFESLTFMDSELNKVYDIELNSDGYSWYNPDLWYNQNEFLVASNRIVDADKSREYLFSAYKMNTSGDILEEVILDRKDTLDYLARKKSLAYYNDSTVYIAGFQSYNQLWTTEPSTAVVYVLDMDMNLLGRKDLGGDAYYDVWGAEATTDGGCLIYGTRYTNMGFYEKDIHIWKVLREDFELITKLTDQPVVVLDSKVWPNPANDVLHISLQGLQTGSDFRLSIYNTAGQKYFDKAFKATAEAVQCHIGVLPSGTYVYEIQSAAGQVGGGKFIKK